VVAVSCQVFQSNPRPAPVALANATQIAAGFQHTCALLEDGTVRCWGYNATGSCGDGTEEADRPAPTKVVGLGNVKRIEVGATSGNACAITEDGGALCWGSNDAGQLATGRPGHETSPTPWGKVSPKSLSIGGDFICGLLDDGTVQCSGLNDYGQLGKKNAFEDQRALPEAVPNLSGVRRLVAGGAFACATRETRRPMCWGSNSHGQFGNGRFDESSAPVAVSW
jgi:alpha-tubulin suppressor-like RCC1 family protein